MRLFVETLETVKSVQVVQSVETVKSVEAVEVVGSVRVRGWRSEDVGQPRPEGRAMVAIIKP